MLSARRSRGRVGRAFLYTIYLSIRSRTILVIHAVYAINHERGMEIGNNHQCEQTTHRHALRSISHATYPTPNQHATCDNIYFNAGAEGLRRLRGADTVHTQMGRPTRHLFESTHTNTHKHTQTHTNTHKHTTRPDKVGAGSRRGGASSSEEGACSTPLPASCIFFCRDPPRRCRALSHAEAVHGHRKSLCLQHICTFISK